jgi:hypothetical protein
MSAIPPSDINYQFHSVRAFPFTKKREFVLVETKHLPQMAFEISPLEGREHLLKSHDWVQVVIENHPYLVKIEDIRRQGFPVLPVDDAETLYSLDQKIKERKTIVQNLIGAGLDSKDALQIAQFLTREMLEALKSDNTYLKKSDSHLPFTLESLEGKVFVLIKGKPLKGVDFAKRGSFKKVTRAVDVETGEVVAHAVTNVTKQARKQTNNPQKLREIEIDLFESLKLECDYLKRFGGYDEKDILVAGVHESDRQNLEHKKEIGDVLVTFITPLAEGTGETLAKKYKNKEVTASQLRSYFSDLLQSVKKMHEAGFVHHDIKPENLLLHQNKLKLNDFGLIKDLSTSFNGGTRLFMPFEVCVREVIKDLYSLAVTIYAIYSGGTDQIRPLYETSFNASHFSQTIVQDLQGQVYFIKDKDQKAIVQAVIDCLSHYADDNDEKLLENFESNLNPEQNGSFL